MKITFQAHASFKIQKNGSTILIDPGKKKFGDISGDFVFVTHNHFDHTRGADIFLERNSQAVLICNEQVAKKFSKWQDRIIQVEPREEIQQVIWKLRFIEGCHGLFSGVQNTGLIVHTSNLGFGHVGDSVDFKGFYQEEMDYIAIPICGFFAASPEKALKELKNFKQPLSTIIIMHWLWRNPHGFCKHLKTKFPDNHCIVPKDGEIVEF